MSIWVKNWALSLLTQVVSEWKAPEAWRNPSIFPFIAYLPPVLPNIVCLTQMGAELLSWHKACAVTRVYNPLFPTEILSSIQLCSICWAWFWVLSCWNFCPSSDHKAIFLSLPGDYSLKIKEQNNSWEERAVKAQNCSYLDKQIHLHEPVLLLAWARRPAFMITYHPPWEDHINP